MIIVIEGPDNTGKTTLCNRLIEKYNYEYLHLGYTLEVEKQYRDLIETIESHIRDNKNLVIDRAHISNIIYSGLFKDADIISDDLFKRISELTNRTIICLPRDRESYLKKYKEEYLDRDDLYENMEGIYDLYKEYFQKHHNELLLYDWREMSDSDIEKFIEEITC